MKLFSLIFLSFFVMLFFIVPSSADFVNGNFSDGLTGWTIGGYGSLRGVEIEQGALFVYSVSSAHAYAYQTVDLTGVDELSFQYYISTANGGRRLGIGFDDSLDVKWQKTAVCGWTDGSIDVSGYEGNTDIYLYSYTSGSGSEMGGYFDNIVAETIGEIELNQSSYVDPEDVQINAELFSYDFTNFSYTTTLYGYLSGSWYALIEVDYNESIGMDTPYKSIVADIDSSVYDLPLYIKAVLNRFNKSDYTTSELAVSDMVNYHRVYEPVGMVEFNKSYYTYPEIVLVDWYIFNGDFSNNEYWIIISGDNGDTRYIVSDDYYEITTSEGSDTFNISYNPLTLPMNVKAGLWRYSMDSGVSSLLGYSDEVIYNPGSINVTAGSIWTSKASYNITEEVMIYADTEDGGSIRIEKATGDVWDSWNVYSGLQAVIFPTQSADVGTWYVYLFEDYIISNQTSFEVELDEAEPYFAWDLYQAYQGEDAYYNYVATSSNSIITITDGLNNTRYQFNATAGYNVGSLSTSLGAPGDWTASLYDGGQHYNDSIEIKSSTSWVRFDRDDYYLGDTITIEYFITSENYKIRLRDGIRLELVEWPPGSFDLGVRGTFEYSLVDDNEFNIDVETKLSSGQYTAGEWQVIITSTLYEPVEGEETEDLADIHFSEGADAIGGTGSDDSIIKQASDVAELGGFKGEVGKFILAIICLLMASGAMLLSKFPVPGVFMCDILLFFGFVGIGFIPIVYLVLFGVVGAFVVFGAIFYKKAG